ncbi:MAG: UDP-3-O-(3-hydroxymyristoyl)glucosamine N-acyltransferase [Bacteroidales bacterium]|nr:UDP-3-O-(3-hydroxymyristoyl)glucosamine N-acyltransferase [Bacteroidales bacterium]
MNLKAKELAELLHGTVEGNPEASVSNFARIEHGKPGTICFLANPKYEHYIYECKASIILVNNDFEPQQPISATLIRVENAYESVAVLLDYVTKKSREYKYHRGAKARWYVSTKFGRKVYVGDFAYIGRRTKVGDYTKIYEHVYIGDDVTIGRNCIIYPGVRLFPKTVIGDNVIIHANAVIGDDGFGFAPRSDGSYMKIEHTGNVVIEDDVEIGSCTTIDRSQTESTIIHKGVKIDNLCMIAHNVEIGEHTALAAQTGIAGSTKVGKHCILGGQTGIAGHLTIADHTSFSAKSGLISNIKEPGNAYMGAPAFLLSDFMRSYAIFRKQGKK